VLLSPPSWPSNAAAIHTQASQGLSRSLPLANLMNTLSHLFALASAVHNKRQWLGGQQGQALQPLHPFRDTPAARQPAARPALGLASMAARVAVPPDAETQFQLSAEQHDQAESRGQMCGRIQQYSLTCRHCSLLAALTLRSEPGYWRGQPGTLGSKGSSTEGGVMAPCVRCHHQLTR
jgi:hypothetical protein